MVYKTLLQSIISQKDKKKAHLAEGAIKAALPSTKVEPKMVLLASGTRTTEVRICYPNMDTID